MYRFGFCLYFWVFFFFGTLFLKNRWFISRRLSWNNKINEYWTFIRCTQTEPNYNVAPCFNGQLTTLFQRSNPKLRTCAYWTNEWRNTLALNYKAYLEQWFSSFLTSRTHKLTQIRPRTPNLTGCLLLDVLVYKTPWPKYSYVLSLYYLWREL